MRTESRLPVGATVTMSPAAAEAATTVPSWAALTVPRLRPVDSAEDSVRAAAGDRASTTHRLPSSGSSSPTRSPPWTARVRPGREVAAPRAASATCTGATECAVRSEKVTVSPAWPMSKSMVPARRAASSVRES